MEPLLIALNGFVDDAGRDIALLPTEDLYSTALEVLVDMEEVLHLLQIMLGEVSDVEVFVVVGVVAGHRENFVVGLAAIQHLEHAQRSTVDLASGERRLIYMDEYVQRIAIFVKRSGNKPVITRIVHRRVQHPVEANHSGRLVELVLVAAAPRDLDDRGNVVGWMNSRWQIVPRVNH